MSDVLDPNKCSNCGDDPVEETGYCRDCLDYKRDRDRWMKNKEVQNAYKEAHRVVCGSCEKRYLERIRYDAPSIEDIELLCPFCGSEDTEYIGVGNAKSSFTEDKS